MHKTRWLKIRVRGRKITIMMQRYFLAIRNVVTKPDSWGSFVILYHSNCHGHVRWSICSPDGEVSSSSDGASLFHYIHGPNV